LSPCACSLAVSPARVEQHGDIGHAGAFGNVETRYRQRLAGEGVGVEPFLQALAHGIRIGKTRCGKNNIVHVIHSGHAGYFLLHLR
jgi:hypothetical protein